MEEPVRIDQCNNIRDFRLIARRRLPGPIFHYIDGAADDEVTYRRNTEAYERCDLVPNVLAGVESIDMSTTVMGQKLKMPLFCSPTALQRLFHHDGERAVAKAAEKFGTMFGVSSLGTVSVEEIGSAISTPKLFQLYFHKDRGLTNQSLRAPLAGVQARLNGRVWALALAGEARSWPMEFSTLGRNWLRAGLPFWRGR